MKNTDQAKYLALIILIAGFFLLSTTLPSSEKDDFSRIQKDIVAMIGGSMTDESERARLWCGDYPCFSSRDFVAAYEQFEKDMGFDLASKYILNHQEADPYIRLRAEARGYRPRPFADESTLVMIEEHRTQQELKTAYLHMRDALLREGIRLHFVSGYRSSTDQRDIFKGKLGDINLETLSDGSHDDLLDTVLNVSAIPGYSKHHSGYAVDFACGNDYLVYEFSETPCYRWMSENNFARSKAFGFIPSYPEALDDQGPRPEPWEFVWVPQDYLR